METKKSEPMVRKVTLIEVRENQQKVNGERKQEKVISSPRKDVRHSGQQWQVPESVSGVSTGEGHWESQPRTYQWPTGSVGGQAW